MNPPGKDAGAQHGGETLIRGVRLAGRPGETPAESADVLIADGRIRAVAPRVEAPRGAEAVDGRGLWLVPGWIDIQVNDMEWIARGRASPLDHATRVREVLRHQSTRGVTGLVLATLAAPLEEIEAYLRGMGMVHAGEPHRAAEDGVFLGALVEGTFMNPALSGAHNPAWILRPDRAVFDRLLAAGPVKLVNIAPETAPEAIDLIRHAASRGVIVGCGHAKPHAERLREAVAAGLRYIIHLGNGPTGSSLKAFHDGGMLEESLRNDDLLVSIILDGVHIHPRLARDWIARKGLGRAIATSDAGFALGPPRGEFEVLGMRGTASPDGRYLAVLPRPGVPAPNPLSSDAAALFGSAADLQDVFAIALNLFARDMEGVYHRSHAALPLAGAVAAASTLCSATPAALLGLEDRGEVAPGKRADLVLLEIDGGPGAYRVAVKRTWTGAADGRAG